MGTGYFLVRGDKTTCGGKIIEGADDHTIMGIPQAPGIWTGSPAADIRECLLLWVAFLKQIFTAG